VHVVIGTRPEAIKLFPVVRALRADGRFAVRVCVSGQHPDMVHGVLALAGLAADRNIALARDGDGLDALTAALLVALGQAIDEERPDWVLVQGDTATAMAGALAAYYRKVPVAHVEAGLRSGDIHHPWPEEVNRRIIATIAARHFAPTQAAVAALRAENIPEAAIHLTGNTIVDALQWVGRRLGEQPALAAGLDGLAARFAGKRIVAVTSHRRENIGDGMGAIAGAVRRLAARPDTAVIWPIHPNPAVGAPVRAELAGLDNIALIEPLDYPHFVRLLTMAALVLTDSGGVQEEAPVLGKPVLVLRRTTERGEGVEAGTALLVGTDSERIVAAATVLLDDPAAYARMARAHRPHGDGRAAERIVAVLGARV
jgi:UDP-N-acetylglucosamine 2-epimerase (non-hydrolysing)